MVSSRLRLWAALQLAACGASEGQLFVPRTEAGPDAASASDASAGTGPVQPGMRLQYQLTGMFAEDVAAELFVIDLFDISRAQIDALHARGKVVVAFVAAGSFEPWRPDVDALPEAAIGNPLPGYPDEAWLDVRDPSVRQLLVGRLTLAADKGFDGVLLVSLDAYLADSGFGLSAADQLAYNLWLAERAAQAGLVAGISSDWQHAAQLAARYAFAIHVNCVADQRCAELDAYRAEGRAVFDLETRFDDSASVCAAANRLRLPVTLKRESFDAWFLACP
jgi:hypothetical protein